MFQNSFQSCSKINKLSFGLRSPVYTCFVLNLQSTLISSFSTLKHVVLLTCLLMLLSWKNKQTFLYFFVIVICFTVTRTVLKAQGSLWCKTHRSNGKLFSYCFITTSADRNATLSWYERLANIITLPAFQQVMLAKSAGPDHKWQNAAYDQSLYSLFA